jgi:drug/metabolite transporter (DMT)-like permease
MLSTLCLILSLLFQTAAIVCNKAAASSGHFTLQHLLTAPLFWATLFCMGCQALTWQIALRRFPLSVAYLVMSLSYVLLLLLSVLIFHETISRGNLIGAALIIGGVILLTHGQTREKNNA